MVLKADYFKAFKVVVSEILVNQELRELYYRKIVEPTFTMAESILNAGLNNTSSSLLISA
jgi:hypothetical protein